jgi:hypothetical protein
MIRRLNEVPEACRNHPERVCGDLVQLAAFALPEAFTGICGPDARRPLRAVKFLNFVFESTT